MFVRPNIPPFYLEMLNDNIIQANNEICLKSKHKLKQISNNK